MQEPGASSNAENAPTGSTQRALAGDVDDLLVREEPLQIVCGDATLLTMRTPGADEDLVLGFLLGEGIVERADQVVALRHEAGDPAALRPDTMHVALAPGRETTARGRLTRTHELRPSCGICGLTDPDELLEELPPLLPGVPRIPVSRLQAMRAALVAHQPLFAATGACHGAAVFDADGTLLAAGEDVGRHNALDKAIGAAARAGHDLTRCAVVLSGRAGYDLVMKCLRVRLPVVLSVSAPSALAHDLARAAGATLVGFLRPDRHRVYLENGRLTDG